MGLIMKNVQKQPEKIERLIFQLSFRSVYKS